MCVCRENPIYDMDMGGGLDDLAMLDRLDVPNGGGGGMQQQQMQPMQMQQMDDGLDELDMLDIPDGGAV